MCFYQPAVIFLPLKSALLPAGCHGGAFEKAFCCCVYTHCGCSKKQPATGTVMEEGCKSSLTDITGTTTTRLPHGHTHMASQSSSPFTVLVGVRSHIRRTSHKDRCGEPAPSLLRAGWCWLTWAATGAGWRWAFCCRGRLTQLLGPHTCPKWRRPLRVPHKLACSCMWALH